MSRALALPAARGPWSTYVLDLLRRRPSRVPAHSGDAAGGDAIADDDLQLGLYLCYELHYGGLPGVDDELEWEPSIIAARLVMERAFVASLVERVGPPVATPEPIADHLRRLVDADGGPSLSRYMAEEGTLDQMREFVIHRSAYQLKEADPHTWAIPRLHGMAKRALVDIQVGEYGAEDHRYQMHASLFAQTMRALGLDDRRNAYLDSLPAPPLANSNLVSMFGLHRRWRGALVGHLTVFEMTSSVPMGRYGAALRRLGADPRACPFYDVHVVADQQHEVIAIERMASGLARDEPALVGDIAFGARAVIALETEFAEHLLGRWHGARTSLRRPHAA